MKIPHFRGVFMRDELPKSGPRRCESGIINLDDKNGPGSHWVAYKKINDRIMYFDSFGNLQPPENVKKYFGAGSIINYNHQRYQDFDTIICGHLCLKFLNNEL